MIWFFLSIFVSAHISYVISTGQRVDTSILLLSSQSQQTASPIQSGNSTGVQSIISYIQTLAQPLGFLGVALGSIVTYVVTPFKKAIGSIISVLASIKTLGIKGYIMKLQKTHLGIDQNDILNSMKSIVPGKKEPPDSDPPPESDPTENDQLNVKKIDINTRSMDDTKVNMGDTKVNMGDTTGLPRLSLNRIMSNPSYRSLEKDSNYISLGNDRFYRDQERPYQERPYERHQERYQERPYERYQERPYERHQERPYERHQERPYQERPYQERPYQERPYQERPYERHQERHQERPYQERPYQERYQERPYQERPYQERYQERPYQERPRPKTVHNTVDIIIPEELIFPRQPETSVPVNDNEFEEIDLNPTPDEIILNPRDLPSMTHGREPVYLPEQTTYTDTVMTALKKLTKSELIRTISETVLHR
ncbi:hypothetical protein [Salmon gill poxvirus]